MTAECVLIAAAAAGTHENELFHDWGMVGVIVSLFTVVPAIFVWLWQKGADVTRAARLRIRAALAGLFQRTVVRATRDVFQQIADRLPDILSQPTKTESGRSNFDHLCAALAAFAKRDENSDGPAATIQAGGPKKDDDLRGILKRMLVEEVKERGTRLLERAEQDAMADGDEARSRTGVRVPIGEEAESTLEFIAACMAKANRRERRFIFGRKWAIRFYLVAPILGIPAIAFVFVDTAWAFVVIICLIAALALALILGTALLALAADSERWLRDTAEKYPSPSDWSAELGKGTIP